MTVTQQLSTHVIFPVPEELARFLETRQCGRQPESLGSFHPSPLLATFSFQPLLLGRVGGLPDCERCLERGKAEMSVNTAQAASLLLLPDRTGHQVKGLFLHSKSQQRLGKR